jgi:competence/damage-inducible protein CinA-like protein
MRAEIIAIGDELTSGQRLDTNSQWLSERLVEIGIDVAFHTTVGDDLETSAAAFRTAFDRADLVVSTGGLGPTADDLTREALALAAGVELEQNDEALAYIRALFARRARTMPERNALQAQFPRDSRPVHNPHGTAPGIDMTIARTCCQPCRVFALPGVPAELQMMWSAVAEAIAAIPGGSRRVTRHWRIKCFGTGESHIEAMLPDMIRRGREPLVGITVSNAVITLRITASGPTEAACVLAMQPTIAQIRESLGLLVFGEEEDELEDAVVRLLKERDQTAAVAEWATAGLVSGRLAEAAGDSGRLRGGVIVRDAAALEVLLGVGGHEAASAAEAEAMARAVRQRTGADYALGVAAFPDTWSREAPGPDQQEPEGKLHIALAVGDNVRSKGFPLAGHPAIVKPRAALQALDMLRLAMLRRE